MGHREGGGEDFVGLHVHQEAAGGLVCAPAARRVGRSQGGNILGSPIDQSQAVEVAAVFGGVGGDKGRTPARVKAVVGVECTQAAKARVDQPEFAISGKRHLVDVDVAGDV